MFDRRHISSLFLLSIIFNENQVFLNNPNVKKHMTKIEKDSIFSVLWKVSYSPVLPVFNQRK